MRLELRVILKLEEIDWYRIGISNSFQCSSTLFCKAELQRFNEKSYLSSWLLFNCIRCRLEQNHSRMSGWICYPIGEQ
jgi:hypothetical protein